MAKGENYWNVFWCRTGSSLGKQTSSGSFIKTSPIWAVFICWGCSTGWFSQMASRLKSLFRTHNFTVKYTVMIQTMFANLLQSEIISEEQWSQVAFPSRRDKTKTHQGSHGHCGTPAVWRSIFVWVPHALTVQKDLLPTWFCFHCKSALLLLKTHISLFSLKYS